MVHTWDMAGIDVSGLGAFIREQRDQAEMSIRQLAKAAEVSNPYLSQVERGLRKPSAEILGRIAQGLRISAETLYVQAGILDQREGDSAVTNAIAADRTITERQRTTLQRSPHGGNPVFNHEGARMDTNFFPPWSL